MNDKMNANGGTGGKEKFSQPMDHATARIVTELAAALLPHLEKTVSAELSKTAGTLPASVEKEVDAALASLRRVRAFSDDVQSALTSAKDTVSSLSGELLPLSGACQTIETAAARLAQSENENAAREKVTNEKFAHEKAVNEKPEVSAELVRSFEAGLSDLGGLLKANARAHTKELSEFSAEMSDQVSWIKSAMPGVIEGMLGKALSSRSEEMAKVSAENFQILENRLTRLEKIGKIMLFISGGVIAFLAVLAAAFCLK